MTGRMDYYELWQRLFSFTYNELEDIIGEGRDTVLYLSTTGVLRPNIQISIDDGEFEITIETLKGDKLHSYENLPAFFRINNDNVALTEQWYKDDKLHNEYNLPAEILRTPRGRVLSECFYQNGIFIKQRSDWFNDDMKIGIEYNNDSECSVCYDIKKCTSNLQCKHTLCQECLESWIGEDKDTCPYCRGLLRCI